MAILKLANAGDEATLDITGCEVVEGQYGEQVQFDAGDDRLYLPRSSADRQLERIFDSGVEDFYQTLIGERLTFSRTPSNKPGGKPFWNINKAKNGAIPPTATPPKSAPPKQAISHSNVPDSALPIELSDEAEVMLDSYLSLTDWVLKRLPPIYEKAGIGMSPESAAASVHTLFIEANKRRVR